MPTEIKICGITSPEAAAHAAGLGADFLGVIVYPKSPRYVAPERLAEVMGPMPEGRRVLVMVAPGAEELRHYRSLPIDFFQIHFDLDTPVSQVALWSTLCGRERLWLAPRIPTEQEPFPQVLMEFADTLLVDTYSKHRHGGTGRTGNWQRFMDWSTLYSHKRWVLAGGLNPENLPEALRLTGAGMVDLNSGLETAPGVKDPAKVAAAIALVRGFGATL